MRATHRQTAVLLLVGLFVVPSQAAGVVQGSPDLSVSLAEKTVTPGEDTTLEFTLTNEGQVQTGEDLSGSTVVTTARGVDVTLEATDAPITVETGVRSLGRLKQGGQARLGYNIAVDRDAKPGTYTMEVTAEYRHTSVVSERTGARNHQTVIRHFDVTVEIDDRAQFEMVSVSDEVAAGSSGTVEVTIQNTGSEAATASSVTLESLNSDLTFDGAASTTRYAGEISPGETQTLFYRVTAVPEAEQQQYGFSATVDFEDEDRVARTSEALSLGVTPRPSHSFRLSNVDSSLRVGEEGSIRGTITNEGETPAHNLVVRYTGESRQINPVARTHAVGTLEPGASANFSVNVEVTGAADAGPRQFEFVAEYRNTENEQRTSEDLLVRERVAPGGDVFVVEPVEATYAPGGGGELDVRVTNAGNERLSSISAKLFADDPISADSKEAFIPELGPGESTVVTFETSVADGALSKTYPVSLDFQYEDSRGDTHVSDSHQIAVDVTEPTEDDGGGGETPLLVGLGAVGLIGVGGYLRYWK